MHGRSPGRPFSWADRLTTLMKMKIPNPLQSILSKPSRQLPIIVSVLFCCLTNNAFAQVDTSFLWAKFTEIAVNARSRKDTGLAEKMFQEALERAETFGERDSRLVTSLVNLADIYAKQRKLSFAEPLYKRLIRIADKTPNFSSQVLPALSQYADLLKSAYKPEEAKNIEDLIRVVEKRAEVDCAAVSSKQSGNKP